MATPTTAGSPAAAVALLLTYLFIIVLAAARPHPHAPAAACDSTGLQPVPLSKPLEFCGGQIGDSTCCGEAKDAALHRAFVSGSFKQQETHQDASCAALVKHRFCAVCFPTSSRIPVDTSIPAPCAALLAPASLSSSTEHLSRSSAPALPSNSICLEKVAAGSYSGLIVAPDGSGRDLVWKQQGELRLASMPPPAGAEMQKGPATPMWVDASPFIDLSALVRYDEARGLRGLISVVSHPRMDGRLFVSYTATKSDDDYDAILVVEELSPGELGFERTTVFSMDLPADKAGLSVLDHGGQIFFMPNDPFLYLVTGHVVSADLVSSNKSSLLGKILQLHVDHDVPAGTGAEIFFSGLNIPRGCALDSYDTLYCANIDETQRERVYSIIYNSTSLATPVLVLDLERPTAGTTSATIVWGLQYQGSADASISGSFIYGYNSAIWSTTVEWPPRPSSGHHTTTRMVVACSRTSPMPCQAGPIVVVSFAEDQNKEGVILTTDAVYRTVASSLCAGGPLGAAPAPASRLSFGALVGTVFGSVVGFMAICWFLAWVVVNKILEADGKDVPCLSLECFRGCACICKDNTCFNCCW